MNIQANSLSSYALQSSSSITTGSLKTTSTADETKQTAISDSLTISAAGMAMYTQSQAAKEALKTVSTGKIEQALADDSALLDSTAASTEETDEDSDTTTNLATLTESQIKQLLSDGKITQAQAQTELATRMASSQ